MDKRKVTAVVKSQSVIAEGIMDLWLMTELSGVAHAGQFVGVYTADATLLLPRPISICEALPEEGLIRLVYRIAGRGTARLALYQPGMVLELIGVLGNGYPIEDGHSLLLGGGIGIPPMLQLAKDLAGRGGAGQVTAVLGYRDADVFLADEMRDTKAEVYIATEDGSVGTRGNVLDVVREKGFRPDVIYACGPVPMLRAVQSYAAEHGIRAYLSLEERMACGVGACLGCVCKTREVDGHSHVHNARVCTEGPVFEASEVVI